MSIVVFLLSMSIILLLTKPNRKRNQSHRKHHQKTKHLSTGPTSNVHTYTNTVLYRTNNKKVFTEKRNQHRLFPIKSELSIQPMSQSVYSTSSSYSLPPLVLTSPSPPPPLIPPATPQPLSVRRLYRSYV